MAVLSSKVGGVKAGVIKAGEAWAGAVPVSVQFWEDACGSSTSLASPDAAAGVCKGDGGFVRAGGWGNQDGWRLPRDEAGPDAGTAGADTPLRRDHGGGRGQPGGA